VECLKAGWNLVRKQYWLFVGLCAVGMLIGSSVPLGILMGPMMCGLYLAFFRVRRGLPIEFGTLFKGFDYFGQSVVAALLHVIPITAVVIAAYVFLYVGMFAAMIAASAAGENAAPFAGIGIFLIFMLFFVVIFLVVIFISIGLLCIPLIVDRGMQASTQSVVGAQPLQLLAFTRHALLGGLLGIVGIALCYVEYFSCSITLAAVAAAYEQVFGLSNAGEVAPNLPPPPPSFLILNE
jgi:hypothetical protein